MREFFTSDSDRSGKNTVIDFYEFVEAVRHNLMHADGGEYGGELLHY